MVGGGLLRLPLQLRVRFPGGLLLQHHLLPWIGGPLGA